MGYGYFGKLILGVVLTTAVAMFVLFLVTGGNAPLAAYLLIAAAITFGGVGQYLLDSSRKTTIN